MSASPDEPSPTESPATESPASEASASEASASEASATDVESTVAESPTLESEVSRPLPASPLDPSAKPSGKGHTQAPPKLVEKRDRFWFWVIGIVALLVVELYVYGHDGRVEVCVGVEGVTDFALKGQPRTPLNMRKLPQCAERLNLGMFNNAEELAKAAWLDACGRATMTTREELPNCMTREKKWVMRVNKHQVAPWDKRLYRRLLWLD